MGHFIKLFLCIHRNFLHGIKIFNEILIEWRFCWRCAHVFAYLGFVECQCLWVFEFILEATHQICSVTVPSSLWIWLGSDGCLVIVHRTEHSFLHREQNLALLLFLSRTKSIWLHVKIWSMECHMSFLTRTAKNAKFILCVWCTAMEWVEIEKHTYSYTEGMVEWWKNTWIWNR